MIEARPYVAGDFDRIRGSLRDTDMRVFMPGVGNLLDLIAGNKYPGDAITVWDGESVVAIGSVHQLWPGVGEACAWTTPLVEQHKKDFCLIAAAFLDRVQDEMGYHRIQCSCLEDFWTSRRWLKRLGFVEEGLMALYTRNGENCVRLARVKV